MPIDPRIINQIQPVQTERPYDRTLRGLQLQNTMLQNRAGQMNLSAAEQELENQRAQQKRDAMIGRVLLQAGGNMEAALPAIRQIDPQYALSVEETLADIKERKASLAKTEEETAGSRTSREQERRQRAFQMLSSAPEQFLPQFYERQRGGLSDMLGQELPPADQFEQQMGMPLSAWVQGQLGEGRPETGEREYLYNTRIVGEDGQPTNVAVYREPDGRITSQPIGAAAPAPRAAQAPQPTLIDTVDDQGRPVQRYVTPRAGAEFPIYRRPEEGADAGTQEALDTNSEILSQITRVINHPGRSRSVGRVRANIPAVLPGDQEKIDFDKEVERLKSILTLKNINEMSGVLSDTDIAILRTAGTSLEQTQSDEAFLDELNRLYDVTSKAMQRLRAGDAPPADQGQQGRPRTMQQLRNVPIEQMTDEELRVIAGGN